ncbi:MAG: serine/threonine protein kinase, partial [Pedosphaera parvula]|nr:serine/threonine protein kinase [Pedosphaera parvula]
MKLELAGGRFAQPQFVAGAGSTAIPAIPDHELLRRIGRGSYGEVWLARSVTGQFRAVKIVTRQGFEDDHPYEREFSGIEKAEPVSRTHAGLVDILHVGRNEEAGCFYYVMELADDQQTGQRLDPDCYQPKTLRSELRTRGRLAPGECVRIVLALLEGLDHLHQHGLVHRDIKPSNIIFVDGRPKLADIGLVTGADETRSFVGTEGYVPPEGPGTPRADLFALGKVLYEMCTGRDRQDFPELPTNLRELPERKELLELNQVIGLACAGEARRRYGSAKAMHADLRLLERGRSVRRHRR